jgi:RHS repeat-associated protein
VAKYTGTGTVIEEYVYDLKGDQSSAHDGSGNLIRAELYSPDGRHVATWKNSSLTYHHADWLGTERMRTNSAGAEIEACSDTPYGMNLVCAGTDISPMHFTGLQYDSETAMSHALNRELNMNLGRWITADPAGKGPVKLDDPQTWNLYAYVRNDPMTLTDPSGLQSQTPNPGHTECPENQNGCGGGPTTPAAPKPKPAHGITLAGGAAGEAFAGAGGGVVHHSEVGGLASINSNGVETAGYTNGATASSATPNKNIPSNADPSAVLGGFSAAVTGTVSSAKTPQEFSGKSLTLSASLGVIAHVGVSISMSKDVLSLSVNVGVGLGIGGYGVVTDTVVNH